MVVFMDFAATLLEGLDQVAAVLLLLLMLSCIALLVLVLIATWKIFVKAGEKGWKSLIPFYSVYIQCRIAGIPKISPGPSAKRPDSALPRRFCR